MSKTKVMVDDLIDQEDELLKYATPEEDYVLGLAHIHDDLITVVEILNSLKLRKLARGE